MFVEFHIGLLLWTVLPPLIYAFILFLTTPYGTFNLQKSLYYVGAGLMSIIFVFMFDAFIEMKALGAFKTHFFIVGPREELSKFLAFLFITFSIKDSSKHPVSTMLSLGMVGLGFALYENLSYTYRYGEDVLITRSFTSTLGHMIFSMCVGYWYALSNIATSFGNRSKNVFNVVMSKYPTIRKVIYTIIGLICGASIHGLWNYNLSSFSRTTIPFMILLIIVGLITCRFGISDLYTKYRRTLHKGSDHV